MKAPIKRCKELLRVLVDASAPVGLEQLQRQLNCSRRTIYYLVSQLNESLAASNLGHIENKRGQGWYLTESQKQLAPAFLDG